MRNAKFKEGFRHGAGGGEQVAKALNAIEAVEALKKGERRKTLDSGGRNDKIAKRLIF